MFQSIKQKILLNGYKPDIILDIGAHHGNWTNDCLNIYSGSKYILFEPIKYNELTRFENNQNIEVIHEILNEKECIVNWYEGRNTGDSMNKELSYHYNNTVPIQRNSFSLNSFSDRIIGNKIFMKIDCQGSEIPILKGASKLYNRIDFIILKIPLFGQYNENTPDFLTHIKFMDDIGFIPFDIIKNNDVNNFTIQLDIIFISKNHSYHRLVQDRLQIKGFNINHSKTVAFLSNKLTLRGTEVALYDYADYNERILGNKSIIITRDYEKIKHEYDVDIKSYQKFHSRFQVEYYNDENTQNDLDLIVEKNKISHLFIIKYGKWDQVISKKCKNLILCVFESFEPHGEVYSVIGQDVNNICKSNYPIVPHIVTVPSTNETLLDELDIPKDAIIFGRYGGKDSFDIGFVYEVIKKILEKRSDIYFLFMNTDVFYKHSNIIYLPGNTDMIYKRKFINTCDALIHARGRGETFGLTCGEFAICEKPVITWANSYEKEHLIILKDKAVVYHNENDLFDILDNFNKNKYDMKNNGYMFYTPENVMQIFKKVYMDD